MGTWRLSHGHHMAMAWLKKICPPDHDYEPPDPGLCAREIRPTTNQPTKQKTHQPTNQRSTSSTKILKNITRTREPTTLKPFSQNLRNYSLIQECRFEECRFR